MALLPIGLYEALLQQTDVVIVDVDIGKDIFQYSAEHISCGEELFDTVGVFPLIMVFLLSGSFR